MKVTQMQLETTLYSEAYFEEIKVELSHDDTTGTEMTLELPEPASRFSLSKEDLESLLATMVNFEKALLAILEGK